MTYQIYIYTLALKDGYYYVGKTIDPDRRFNEHFSDKGAVWTKLHPPVSVIEKESFLVSSLEEEDRWENHQTIKMMKAKGWQMVRGGYWCNVGEIETIKHLQHCGYFLDIDIKDISFSKREYYIYLLELENNKYYVGYSRSLKSALKRQEKGTASNWTYINKPIRLLKYQEAVFENGIPDMNMVNEWVLQCGAEYGYENVRGGSFNLLEPEQHCKYSINSLVYWVTYVHNVVYSFYRSMIYCYINSTQRCAGSIVIDIIPTNGADKRKFFPFAPYFPVTNVIKRYFYPYFPAIIGIKGYSFPYFPYLSGIMKIKTALYSLFSRLDWHKTVVFPCLGEIYEGIRSLSWEIPVT